MSEGTQGLVVLGVISVSLSLLVHYFSRAYLPASLVSAVLASGLFQVVGYFHTGYLDPFFAIAFTIGTAAAFFISLVIGYLFKKRRERAGEQPGR